jgi:hypothetical protein
MKTIEEQIEVMQAYADGKNIKRRADSPFTNSDKNTIFNRRERTTDFSWASFDYNIVEEPITKYMIVTLSGGSICDYPSYAKAKKCWTFKNVVLIKSSS